MLRAPLCTALAASLLSISAAAQSPSATREKVLAALPGLKALAEQTVDKGDGAWPVDRRRRSRRGGLPRGFGVRRTDDTDTVDPTRSFSSPRLPSRLRRPWSRGWSAMATSRGTASIRDIDPALRCTTPLLRRGHAARPVLPSQRLVGPRRRRHRGARLLPGRNPPRLRLAEPPTASAAATMTAPRPDRGPSRRRASPARTGPEPPRSGCTSRSA